MVNEVDDVKERSGGDNLSSMRCSRAEDLPPFYFMVVFWGEEHRNYFIDFSLSSLLAPGNIPALKNLEKSRFLISTTAEDWAALEQAPLFKLLKKYMQPEWLEIPMPSAEQNKMNVMSSGHLRLTQAAHEASALGINLNPDTIFCDDSMSRLQQLAMEGKRLVFHSAIRFELEGTIGEMTKRGLFEKDKPLVIQRREGVDISLRHRHSELNSCNFLSPAFWDYPVHTLRNIPGEHGLSIHSFSWAALLVDYGTIDDHDTSTFDKWTLDGDYIYNNFQHIDAEKEVHVVRDSDDIFIISVTPHDEANVPDTPQVIKSINVIGDIYKGYLINIVFCDDRIDVMKKLMFVEPVRMHSQDITPIWDEIERSLNKTLALSLTVLDEEWGGLSLKKALVGLRQKVWPSLKYEKIHIQERIVEKRPVSIKELASWVKNIINTALVKIRNSMGYYLYYILPPMIRYTYLFLFYTYYFTRRLIALTIFHGYYETIRRIILVFAYSRTMILALFGNKIEQQRIKRRVNIIKDHFSGISERG